MYTAFSNELQPDHLAPRLDWQSKIYISVFMDADNDAPSQRNFMCACASVTLKGRQKNITHLQHECCKPINTSRVFRLNSGTRRQSSFCPSTIHKHQKHVETRNVYTQQQKLKISTIPLRQPRPATLFFHSSLPLITSHSFAVTTRPR